MREYLNFLGRERTPFFFIIGFNTDDSYIVPMEELDGDIRFELDGFTSRGHSLPRVNKPLQFKKFPAPFADYKKRFDLLQEEITAGNTYLANLTMPTRSNFFLKTSSSFLVPNVLSASSMTPSKPSR